MREVITILASIMFGLLGGYGWSAMAPAKTEAVALPPATTLIPADAPPSADDKEWASRGHEEGPITVQAVPDPTLVEQSVTYAGCNEVRAAGKAPLYAGQPGYRAEMDGDGDGIACEPNPGA
jgi:hypothetical protein